MNLRLAGRIFEVLQGFTTPNSSDTSKSSKIENAGFEHTMLFGIAIGSSLTGATCLLCKRRSQFKRGTEGETRSLLQIGEVIPTTDEESEQRRWIL
jgi:hypothetical protein